MKRGFFFCIFFLALSSFAPASTELPLNLYFQYADTVYLAHVISEDHGLVTFSVKETWRGKSVAVLRLTAEFQGLFKPESDWVLYSCAPWREVPRKDVVGGSMEGTVG